MGGLTVAHRSALAFALAMIVLVVASGCTRDPNTRKTAYLERGTKHLAETKYNDAIVEFKNALQIDPNFAPALAGIGRAYKAKSWHADAARELQRAVKVQPDDLLLRADLGQVLLDLEAWKEALAEGESIQQRKHDSAAGWYLVGAAHLGMRQIPQAIEELYKALQGSEPNAAYHKAYGDALAAADR